MTSMSASAQDTIWLKNPSFEAAQAEHSTVPAGWVNLGRKSESPPDIQPGFFKVKLPAQDGKTYIGLVVRKDNTVEGVGQQLNGLLQKDSAYSFSLYLTRSPQYVSGTKQETGLINFVSPTVLKVWGRNWNTGLSELLVETSAVQLFNWTRYTFILQPKVTDIDELGFRPSNGNLLMDNCSAIVPIKN